MSSVSTRRSKRATPTHRPTHPCNGPFSETTQVSRYQKGKTNLDFSEARDSEWQWHQLGRMQVCPLAPDRQPHQHPTTLFLQAGCPSCRRTNRVKALNAKSHTKVSLYYSSAVNSVGHQKKNYVFDLSVHVYVRACSPSGLPSTSNSACSGQTAFDVPRRPVVAAGTARENSDGSGAADSRTQ